MRTKKMRRAVFAVLVVLCMCGPVFAGQTIYVDADAKGANAGTGWADAFLCLQDALAASSNGDEIWVAQGIYKPDSTSADPNGTGNRSATFQLINGVTIKGGYAGSGEPDPNARDAKVYETILSGDLDGNDVGDLNDPSREENSYHVVTASGTDGTAVLDGFTITAGNADGPDPSNKGGGMYNYQGRPTVTSCTISGNSATIGGGMYTCRDKPTLTNCTFVGNAATQSGGGMYSYDYPGPELTDCTISSNTANEDGGAMLNDYYSKPRLTNCAVSDNTAGDDGGGICNQEASDSRLTNCTISDNMAGDDGGAICNQGASEASLAKCTVRNNTAGGAGGGIWSEGGDLWITGCIISRNSANEYGGGVYICETVSMLCGCTLSANSASAGKAVAYDGSSGTHQVIDCILWDGGSEIWKNVGVSPSITYSDVEGDWPGTGNINVDPCFADIANDDYHLRSEAGRWDPNQNVWVHDANTSLCIDAGYHVFECRYELWPHGKRVNMGVYGNTSQASMSLSSVGNIADLNNSGFVNWKDLRLLVNKWLRQEVLLAEDLNRNGIVNFIDFAIFAAEFPGTSAAEPSITYQIDDCDLEAFELSASEQSGQTRFTVTVEGSYIHFEDMMVANCCPDELGLEMTVEDDLITIYETEYTPAGCWCICDYPVAATLGPFEPGTYTLQVYEDHGGFIGTTTVTIGPD